MRIRAVSTTVGGGVHYPDIGSQLRTTRAIYTYVYAVRRAVAAVIVFVFALQLSSASCMLSSSVPMLATYYILLTCNQSKVLLANNYTCV
jgi:predicted exporter